MTPEPWGARLRRLREGAGLTREALAEQAGLSANAIAALERSEHKHPYTHSVVALADALGLVGAESDAFRQAVPTRVAIPRGVDRGFLALQQGAWEQASHLLSGLLPGLVALRDHTYLGLCLLGLAVVGNEQGEPRKAARLLGAAAWIKARGEQLEPCKQQLWDRYVAAIRAQLDERTWHAAWSIEQGLALEQVVDDALRQDR